MDEPNLTIDTKPNSLNDPEMGPLISDDNDVEQLGLDVADPFVTDPNFHSLAFMQFKDDLVDALERLKRLKLRERELESRLSASEAEKRKSEVEGRRLKAELEKRERDGVDAARHRDLEDERKREEWRLQLGKKDTDLWVLSKMKEAMEKESESVKTSLLKTEKRLEQQMEALEESLRTKEVQKKRISLLESTMADVEGSLKHALDREKKLKLAFLEAEKKLGDLEERLLCSRKAEEDAKVELKRCRSENDDLETRLAKRNHEAEESKIRVQQASWRDEQFRALEKRVGELNAEKIELLQDRDQLEAVIGDLTEASKISSRLRVELEAKLERAVEEARDRDEALRLTKEDKEKAETSLVEKDSALTVSRIEIKEKLADMETTAKASSLEKENLVRDVKKWSEKAEAGERTIAELTKRLELTREEADSDRRRFKAASKDWEEKEACFSVQLSEMGFLRQQLDELQTENLNHFQSFLAVASKASNAKTDVHEDLKQFGE